MLSSTSTYTIKSDVTYPPSPDSFHICHSKGWGMDVHKVGSYCIFSYTDMFRDPCGKAYFQSVHKVGSYCIFSYTDMFQDPCGKAYFQSVHSEAVSFRHVSYNHRIPRNTSFYTCGPPCSRHSFQYKAFYTGTANRPLFLYITFRGIIQSDS